MIILTPTIPLFIDFFLVAESIIIFMGIFLIAEAIFSIIYYFEGPTLPHIFRGIRVAFGSILVIRGVWEIVHGTTPDIWWSQVGLIIIVALSILAGYEVAQVIQARQKTE